LPWSFQAGICRGIKKRWHAGDLGVYSQAT
jgi:hypothetical protein